MDKTISLPNSFYDLIVFLIPTLVITLGLLLGFAYRFNYVEVTGEISGPAWFALALAYLAVAYEYGRAAEAWSAPLVQKPLFWMQERLGWPRDDNFSWAPDANELGLTPRLDDPAAKNRWTFYFLAFHIDPPLGSDLLKRYAWEKLARSSALSYLILAFASLSFGLIALVSSADVEPGLLGFGGYRYTLAMLLLAIVSTAEYYRRNLWNMDLLYKVTPVLRLALRRGITSAKGLELTNPLSSREKDS